MLEICKSYAEHTHQHPQLVTITLGKGCMVTWLNEKEVFYDYRQSEGSGPIE